MRLHLAIRYPVAALFGVTLLCAAYLGFASIHLGHDKLIHFITFFILTAEFYYMWQIHRPWKVTLICMTAGACVGSEFVQNLVNPARVFDWMDIVYNVHGSGLALILCVVQSTWTSAPALGVRSESPGHDYVNISMGDVWSQPTKETRP